MPTNKQKKKKNYLAQTVAGAGPWLRVSDSLAPQAGRAALRDPHARQWDTLTRHIKRLSLGFTAANTTLFWLKFYTPSPYKKKSSHRK